MIETLSITFWTLNYGNYMVYSLFMGDAGYIYIYMYIFLTVYFPNRSKFEESVFNTCENPCVYFVRVIVQIGQID